MASVRERKDDKESVMSKQVRITHVGGSVSGGTHRNIGVDGGRFFSIHPGLADKLGMDVGEHGTLLFIPKSEKVEGLVDEALSELVRAGDVLYHEGCREESAPKCAHAERCREKAAAARAELAARGQGRVVEIELTADHRLIFGVGRFAAYQLVKNVARGVAGAIEFVDGDWGHTYTLTITRLPDLEPEKVGRPFVIRPNHAVEGELLCDRCHEATPLEETHCSVCGLKFGEPRDLPEVDDE